MKMDPLYADENVLVGRVVLEPGGKIAEEIHVGRIETIVLIRGKIEADHLVGHLSTSILMHAMHLALGSIGITFVEAGRAHVVRNPSETEPAEYIAILRRVS